VPRQSRFGRLFARNRRRGPALSRSARGPANGTPGGRAFLQVPTRVGRSGPMRRSRVQRVCVRRRVAARSWRRGRVATAPPWPPHPPNLRQSRPRRAFRDPRAPHRC
jgi:hypothetical protein